MKYFEFWFDEFKRGNYMPLTPKIKNKRNLGAKRHQTRLTLKDEKALLHFTRFFADKNYTIIRNPKGKYYIVIMNYSELSKNDWFAFLDYVKAVEQYESE